MINCYLPEFPKKLSISAGYFISFLVVISLLISAGAVHAAGEGARKYAKIGEYEVAYREWGSDGPAIVLVHGIPITSALWSGVGPLLADAGYHVFAPEQLGLGYTKAPLDVDHSLRGQAEMMTNFVNQVVKEPFVLFGHDVGGGVVQIMLTDSELKDRNKVRKLIIGNAVVLDSWPTPEAGQLVAAAHSQSPEEFYTAERTAELIQGGVASGLLKPDEVLTPEILEDISGHYSSSERYRRHFIKFLRSMDNRLTLEASPKMSMFKKPVMLLWGVRDEYQPVHGPGIAFAQLMPHAYWHPVEGGHFYPLGIPDVVAKAIIEWDQREF